MHIVLFLGAGFSRAFGMPVMNEFFSFVRESPRIDEAEQKLVSALLLEARRANSFVESSPRNLEDVLSLAVMRERLDGAAYAERLSRLRHVLRKVYTSRQSESSDYWHQFSPFKSFLNLDLTSQKNQLSIVTTNYDLNIESALYTIGHRANLGFDFSEISGGNIRFLQQSLYVRNGGVPVFKLHGSVNWYNGDTETELPRVDSRIAEVTMARAQQGSLPYPCIRDYPAPAPPVIVPPSFLKPELASPLHAIWQGAANTLRTANQLVFVGYSFPGSDTEMRYFLAAGLSENSQLDRIRIVDPNANAIVARLCAPESRFGSHFRDFLRAEPKPWQDIALSWDGSG